MPGSSAAALTPAGRRPPHLRPLHRPENCACLRVYSPRPPCEHLDPPPVGHFGFSCLCACRPLQRHPYCDHPPTPGLRPLPRAHCQSPALRALVFALSYNDLLHVCQVALLCVRVCPVCVPGHSDVCVRARPVGNVPWNWSLACDGRDVNTIMSLLQLKSGLGEMRRRAQGAWWHGPSWFVHSSGAGPLPRGPCRHPTHGRSWTAPRCSAVSVHRNRH